jgi:hypothetical protein
VWGGGELVKSYYSNGNVKILLKCNQQLVLNRSSTDFDALHVTGITVSENIEKNKKVKIELSKGPHTRSNSLRNHYVCAKTWLCKHTHIHGQAVCVNLSPQYVFVYYVDIMSDTEIACAVIIIVCLTEKKNEKESREYG